MRVGIVLPAPGTPDWMGTLVDRLAATPGLQVTVLPEGPSGSGWDVLVDPGDRAPDVWEDSARGGLWRLRDGDGRPLADAFPALPAFARGAVPEVLVVRGPQARPRLVRRAHLAPAPDYPRLRSIAIETAIRLVRQLLLELREGLELPDLAESAPVAPPSGRAGVLSDRIRARLRAVGGRFRRMIVDESWMLGTIDHPIEEVLDLPPPLPIRWVGPRQHRRYLADPFPLPDAPDRLYCETYDQRTALGQIAEVTLADGRIIAERPVPFPVPGHLSYPYLFAHDGVRYCMPEVPASRSCVLYAEDPAGGWRPLATLLEDVLAADATIFHREGRFWLAYTDGDLGLHDNLCLCYADRLEGPWRPHPANPVKIDAASARPAGTPFVRAGALYRPAQDCRRHYGGAVAINRVLVLTPTRFREETVRWLNPDRGGANPDGLHTLSAWGGRTVVDGKRHLPNPYGLWRRARLRWQRLRPG